MYCENCGAELPDNATFCSSCGKKIAHGQNKNVYIALLLTFIFTGLGSIYAGNTKKGLILLGVRVLLIAIGVFVNIVLILAMLVWAYAYFEAYRDVQIANGHSNPNFINEFKGWNRNNQIIAVLIIAIILIFTVSSCVSILTVNSYSDDDSNTHYYVSNGGSSSSSSSHYSGVDDSPHTIAKNDPDWYYDHYEYGDNDKIDEYLESQGYD
ncbi:zinc-ribbon domain-containing protein [Methanobrevibacter sp.]|uniref:zinc ribbon domain-containing protein n=1 Tax=Methanobrevibacter sp. TaxID=66852 RepID=UPI00388F7FF7